MRLAEIRGQERAVAALQKDIAAGRVAPSYLFVGPESVGKRTAALAFARTLLCLNREKGHGGPDACGECRACRKVRAKSHPDLLVIHRHGAVIKVGEFESKRKEGDPPQIRQLIEAAQRKPFEGPVKVLVVEEAHRMNASAANALLKTLEEPPADTVILLTATTLGALPQTVVSRCRVVRFSALERSWLASQIERGRCLPAGEARLLAAFAEGRMDRALEADPEEVKGRRAKALELLDAALEGRTRDVLRSVAGAGRSREEAEAVLDVFLSLVRDICALQRGSPADLLTHEDLADGLRRRAGAWPRETLEALFDRARQLRTNIRVRNANPQLGLEALLLGPEPAAAVGGESVEGMDRRPQFPQEQTGRPIQRG